MTARSIVPLATVAVVALLLLSAAHDVRAWGQDGHISVAQIAYTYLSPRVRGQVDALLQGAGFSDIGDASTWPDRIRRQRPNTGPWHYVGKSDDPSKGRCTLKFPTDCVNEQCVITAIADMTRAVADQGGAAQERGEALAFLTHFVGDIAQPLHASGYLRGSNGVKVLFRKKKTNLHSVWDSSLLQKTIKDNHGGSRDAYIQVLLDRQGAKARTAPGTACAAAVDPNNVKQTQKCATEWAQESNALVCKVVYPDFFEPDMDTSTEYYENAKETVDEQIVKGGVRLAALLNKIIA